MKYADFLPYIMPATETLAGLWHVFIWKTNVDLLNEMKKIDELFYMYIEQYICIFGHYGDLF
jgi:hypothetical protein